MKSLLSVITGLLALFFRPQKAEQATPKPQKAAPTGVSPDGLAILQYFESCRLEAYWDADGKVWTIGWGDTGPDVVKGLRITQAEADDRLKRRLAREFVPGVLASLARPVSQAQLDAMVDLAYNIGVGAFQGSTLVRLFNAGDQAGAAEQFPRWNKSGGKVLLGLRRRRAADSARFLGASGAEAIKIGAAVV
ncbi:lysozyme [Alcaligenes faecalis]|uniref:Lysozyme n=1 Tax=Alcaligenes faecalis TaxID=511 RepID=A0ABY7N6F7_ALCFA|nr:lysozyme [Alcaligenes faecalis]WBM39705.1 lysozyme [Alcaligenes faecalis]